MTKYHYTLCGLDNIYVINAGFEKAGDEGPSLTIPGMRLLHTVIAMGLIVRDCALRGFELRFLRNEFRESLEDIFKILKIDLEQILNWEEENKELPLKAEQVLRWHFLLKLYDRKEKYLQNAIDISDDLDKARMSLETWLEKTNADKALQSFSPAFPDREHFVSEKKARWSADDLSMRAILNAADRDIEISHDGGGLYRLRFD